MRIFVFYYFENDFCNVLRLHRKFKKSKGNESKKHLQHLWWAQSSSLSYADNLIHLWSGGILLCARKSSARWGQSLEWSPCSPELTASWGGREGGCYRGNVDLNNLNRGIGKEGWQDSCCMALQRSVTAKVTFSSVLFCIFNSMPIRRQMAGSGGSLTWSLEWWRPLDYSGGRKGLLGSMSMSVWSLSHT